MWVREGNGKRWDMAWGRPEAKSQQYDEKYQVA
eukprot:COSAG02_NODE_50896_length_317_cov_1.344037_1_plen_32_part_01